MPRRRLGVRNPDRRAAPLQHVRPAAGALEPVHRRARDLRGAAAEQPAAADLRRRTAASRLRLGPRRRARVRTCVGEDGADGLAVNIGSGRSVTVRDLARQLGAVVGRDLEPEITGESRVGDIRHCFADVGLAQETLGYAPEVELADGMTALAAWLEGQTAEDRVDDATEELTKRGLAR